MKKDVAEIWVAALRSGKYEQGQGALKQNNEFCCLGVLCDVLNTPIMEIHKEYGNRTSYGVSPLDSSANILPFSVIHNIGMSNRSGTFKLSSGIFTSLVEMNDNGTSFFELADIIEKHSEEL